MIKKYDILTPRDLDGFLTKCFSGGGCDALTGHSIELTADVVGVRHKAWDTSYSQNILDMKNLREDIKSVADLVRKKSLSGPSAFREYSAIVFTYADSSTATIEITSSIAGEILFKDTLKALEDNQKMFAGKKLMGVHHIHSHPGKEYRDAMGIGDNKQFAPLINHVDYNFYHELSAFLSSINQEPTQVTGIVVPVGKHLDHAYFETTATADKKLVSEWELNPTSLLIRIQNDPRWQK